VFIFSKQKFLKAEIQLKDEEDKKEGKKNENNKEYNKGNKRTNTKTKRMELKGMMGGG
jgi:hypothetical protein